MSKYSLKLIELTRQVWTKDSDCDLTDQDAIEIIDNSLALFDLILELERKYGKA